MNALTKGPSHIDLILGFSTGEIIWYEPISAKYTRLNKNVCWDTASPLEAKPPTQGVINANPVSQIRWIPGSDNLFLAAHVDGSLIVYDKEKEDASFSPEEFVAVGNGQSPESEPWSGPVELSIKKSVHSQNQRCNPVSFWKLSNQRINAFAFSPDSRHVAVVSEDGKLRVVDYLKEQYD